MSAGTKAEQQPGHSHRDADDHSDERGDEEHGRHADDVGCDQPADRDVHDRVGHRDGRLVALDEPGEALGDRLAERRDPGRTLPRGGGAGGGFGEAPPGGEPEDVGAHRLGVAGREVLELDVRVGARADHLELRHPEQPRHHRPREVHALDAVERRPALGAEQDAAAHLDVVPGDPERVEAPRQVEDADQHEQDAEHDQHRDEVQVVRDHEVDRVAGALELLEVFRSGCRGRGRAGRGRASRSRRFATTIPRMTSRNSPPRSSGVSGCSRCQSPSLSGERSGGARGGRRRLVAAGRGTGSVIGPCDGSRRPRRGGRAASRRSSARVRGS